MNSFHEYRQSNINYESYFQDAITAFSINWPHVAFSGIDGVLVIINVFD